MFHIDLYLNDVIHLTAQGILLHNIILLEHSYTHVCNKPFSASTTRRPEHEWNVLVCDNWQFGKNLITLIN